MTPEQFIATWKNNPLTERAGAQAHFDDLCDLLGVPKPRDPENYCFERGAKKAGGGDGWADVWMRSRFGWENKKPGRDLDAALKQLTDYSLQLDNPPLLVVCDRERIVIHTAFTGYPDEPREIRIEQLVDPEIRQILRWVFTDPEKLRPEKSTAAITAEAAGHFAELAAAMRRRGQAGADVGQRVAHFLVQCLFCMFAEDENLLPAGVFTDLLKNAGGDTDKAARRIEKLFRAMQQNGGEYGDHDIAWFNGGLFKIIDIPPLTATDLAALHRAAADMDWRGIDPTIFGTLFERGLDPAARAPLGAHFTDTGTITKLIDPLISEPLLAEWARTKAEILARPKKARAAYQTFLLRLNHFRVLDPACGSGNFLYLALKALRDVEKRAHVEAQELGLGAELSMQTGPHNILGLEINEFAAELARVTVWIGDIQWCRRNGYPHAINPILKPLDGIEHCDALLNPRRQRDRMADRRRHRRQPAFPRRQASCAANSAPTTSKRCAKPTTAASPAAPTSSPTGSRKPAPRSRPANCKPPASSPPTRSAAAPTARCSSGSSPRRAFSRRGATRNGSMKAPPCAFRCLVLGRFFRLTVAVGWMGLRLPRFTPI